MIDDGVLDNPKVGMAVAIHVWAELPVGTAGVIVGPCMAAVDEFEAKVKGVGGHAAYPHHSVDPVLISAHIITGLQSIVSRNIPPMDSAVVTVASIQAGNVFNIIPSEVVMKGTCRSFSKEAHRLVEKRFREIVQGVAKSLGGSADIIFEHKTPATVNDPKACDLVRDVAAAVLGKKKVLSPNPTMGGEDMSLYLQKVPGCFAFLGMRNPAKGSIWPHHHPKFTVDEDVLPVGVEIMYRVARAYYS
jgi:amidohydrolase